MRAAIEMIGAEGAKATTVRRVAQAAGVSAPLVLHHFGSKAGLIGACDEHVLGLVETLIDAMSATDGSVEAGIQHLLARPDAAAGIVYIGRSLQDDGELGRVWFHRLYELTRAGVDEMTAAGVARPVDDPTMTALLLLAMDLGMVLLRPHVERVLDGALTDAAITERWVTAEFDLFTRALFTANPSDDVPADGSRETP